MPLVAVKTDKVYGRVNNVHIGYDSSHGVDINSGILSFEYHRNHDAIRYEYPGATTTPDIFEKPSNFSWTLKFLSDCRVAFFETDVQTTAGNQYAMLDDGHSNEIEYFKIKVPIEIDEGISKTRTYTITGGYALRNHAYIGDDKVAEYEYEGDAEYISYEDA